MKQKLKISIGSSLQKAATCLTVAATIATLGFTFSCSSDNDYEEPWLNKEHKTRAGNPESGLYMLEAGTTSATFTDSRIKVKFDISWGDSPNAHTMPQPTADDEGADVTKKDTSVQPGHATFLRYIGSNGTGGNLDMMWTYTYTYYDSIERRRKSHEMDEQLIHVPSDKFYIIP